MHPFNAGTTVSSNSNRTLFVELCSLNDTFISSDIFFNFKRAGGASESEPLETTNSW